MKSSQTSIRYLAWFLFPVLSFLMLAIPLSLYFEPLSGDLTRIGHWSERDFGWNKAQPEIPVLVNKALKPVPDVLVLGDSFSHSNVWQKYLSEKSDLSITSFQYQDVGCVSNWLNWIEKENYLKAEVVIIEIVERSLISVFKNLYQCSVTEPKLQIVDDQISSNARKNIRVTLDGGYLFPTALNTLMASWSDQRIDSSGVVNAPLITDKLFSNKKANRLLYYAEDDLKANWSMKDKAAAVGNLKLIQNGLEQKGIRLIVVVVPDKSSIYRNFLANKTGSTEYPNVFMKLKLAGVNNVNLLEPFQQNVREVVDLYLPNDTHLSVQGYKLMASEIADSMSMNND